MIRIRRGTLGIELSSKIINRDDPATPVTQNLTNFAELSIILRHADGREIILPAIPENASNLSNTPIVYRQPLTEPSIFPVDSDEGFWEFRPAVKYANGSYFESYDAVPLAIV